MTLSVHTKERQAELIRGRAARTATEQPSVKGTDGTENRSKEFENLVLEHLDMLYGVALRLTRNRADAQDLTQNTVVKALRFHDKFEEGTYIKAWLLTILRNTFVNSYRRKMRRPIFVELSGIELNNMAVQEPEVAYETVSPDSQMLMELLDDEVKCAVESLPNDFRKAVILADLKDMSYKEIAQEMDCPLGTVMSRLNRARKLLRKQLFDYAKNQRIVDDEKEI